MTTTASRTRNLILISIFAALVAIGAFIRIPLPFSPIPVTLQFIFTAYAGLFLGLRRGFYVILLYIVIGLTGIPVFTQGGGIGYVFVPTFGFLIGFAFSTAWIGWGRAQLKEYRFFPLFGIILSGLFMVYLFGWFYLYWLLTVYGGKGITLTQTFMMGVAPFITNDIIFATIAALTAVKVLPILQRLGYLE